MYPPRNEGAMVNGILQAAAKLAVFAGVVALCYYGSEKLTWASFTDCLIGILLLIEIDKRVGIRVYG